MKRKIFIAACIAFIVAAIGKDSGNADTRGEKSVVTFARDVAPILQKRCEQCHHQGGVAPMSLATFEETRPWARSIKEKVVTRQMPPFHAAGQIGRYVNDPRLTDAEIATITRWVDAGAPRGDLKSPAQGREWKNEWAHGEPDLVVKVPRPYTLKPSQKDQYVFFVFDYVFPDDTWIRGVDTRPGNPRAVHHANT